jgi:hypothetical protein
MSFKGGYWPSHGFNIDVEVGWHLLDLKKMTAICLLNK